MNQKILLKYKKSNCERKSSIIGSISLYSQKMIVISLSSSTEFGIIIDITNKISSYVDKAWILPNTEFYTRTMIVLL